MYEDYFRTDGSSSLECRSYMDVPNWTESYNTDGNIKLLEKILEQVNPKLTFLEYRRLERNFKECVDSDAGDGCYSWGTDTFKKLEISDVINFLEGLKIDWTNVDCKHE